MNNDILDALRNRRSIRSFKPEQIKREELETILMLGTYAPTGKGEQSPVIVVVQDEETIKQLVEMNKKVMGAEFDPYYAAPTIVLVFSDRNHTTPVEDGACVLLQMMLAAHGLGIGSCWINREREMFKTEEGRAFMDKWGLTPNYKGIGALSLGYPAQEAPVAAGRKKGYIIWAE